MAAEKTTKRKQQKSARASGAGSGEATSLRMLGDPRQERRYEPKASTIALVAVIALSIGAVLVGAGTYGQWLRSEELGPHKYAPYLLVAGAVLLVGVALFGQRNVFPVRVGDAGVGLEKEPTDIERIEWRAVTQLLLASDGLTVQAHGAMITIPLPLHAQAVARIVKEAKARIPKRIEDIDAESLPKVAAGAGEVIPLDPPQIAGARCRKTDKLIAFEKDARLCGRCGEIYHKDSVPPRCLTCDARLA